MKMISLAQLAAEAAYTADGNRNLSGKLVYTEDLEAAFHKFDSLTQCMYVFLAFHPKSDAAMSQYILEDSVSDDAGPNLMALFLSPDQVSLPRAIRRSDLLFGVEVKREEHPAYKLARSFYPTDALPKFPGLIFFDSLSAPTHSVYVAVGGDSAASFRTACRRVFEAANKCFVFPDPTVEDRKPDFDFDRFAAELYDLDITYHRTDTVGARAATLLVGVWIKKHAKAIISVIPKLVEVLVKAKTGTPPGVGH